MPLPISSQTYMPNPLLVPEAKQAGLNYGQDIISGIIDSAQGAANVVSTIQDIQMKPEKLEMEKQQVQNELQKTRIQQQALEINQKKEQRLGEQFQIQQDLRQDQFDLRQKEYDLKLRRYGDKVRNANLDASVGLGKQKEKQLFDNVLSEYYNNGNTDALTGFMGDSSTPAGRRRQAAFVDYLTAEKNMAVSSQVMSRMRDDLSRLNKDSQQAQVLRNTIDAATFKTKLSQQSKLADREGRKLQDALAVAMDRQQKIAFSKVESTGGVGDFGFIEVSQVDRTGKITPKGKIVLNGQPEQLNHLYSARDSHNAVLDLIEDRRRQTLESIPKAAQQQSQQERPAKDVKKQAPQTTSFQRSGTLPTKEQGVEAEKQTKATLDKRNKPNYSERLNARNRTRDLLGRKRVERISSTPEEDKALREALASGKYNIQEEGIVLGNRELLNKPFLYK